MGRWLARVLLIGVAAAAPAAAYDGGGSGGMGLHTATSIGAQAAYYRPLDADRGEWGPGAALRLHMTPEYSLEASADYVHYRSMGTSVQATPVQVTVLGYFYPQSSISPYLLLGGGWYPTHADGPYNPQRLFGPHIGAGLELLLGGNWSLDGSYRFLWTEIISWSQPTHVVGSDFAERGYLVDINLNYRL